MPTDEQTTDRTDLRRDPIQLRPGGRAEPVPGFGWEPELLAAYAERYRADGADGRLVMQFEHRASWTMWEAHPAGDEVVVQLTGSSVMIQQVGGAERRVTLQPGEAVINPAGVWHTADVVEPGTMLTITPGLGTDHRPREAAPDPAR